MANKFKAISQAALFASGRQASSGGNNVETVDITWLIQPESLLSQDNLVRFYFVYIHKYTYEIYKKDLQGYEVREYEIFS